MKCTTDKGGVIHLICTTITKEMLIFKDVNKLVIKFMSPLRSNFENFSFISSCFLLMFTALGCPSSCVSGVLVSSHSAPPVPITVFILLFPSAVHSGFSSHPQSTCLTRPVKVRRILTHFWLENECDSKSSYAMHYRTQGHTCLFQVCADTKVLEVSRGFN